MEGVNPDDSRSDDGNPDESVPIYQSNPPAPLGINIGRLVQEINATNTLMREKYLTMKQTIESYDVARRQVYNAISSGNQHIIQRANFQCDTYWYAFCTTNTEYSDLSVRQMQKLALLTSRVVDGIRMDSQNNMWDVLNRLAGVLMLKADEGSVNPF